MDLNTVHSFLMWCTIINGSLLLTFLDSGKCRRRGLSHAYGLVCHAEGDPQYPQLLFHGIFKIIYLVFNLVPYAALVIAA